MANDALERLSAASNKIWSYPLNISDSGAFMLFIPHKYKTVTSVNPVTKKKAKQYFGGGVALPVTKSLQEEFSSEWETTTNSTNMLDTILAALGSNVSDAVGIFGRKAALESGVSTVNADVVQLYKGTSPREFPFQWDLAPESPSEAQEIKHIIRIFKYLASPAVGSGNAFTKKLQEIVNGVSRAKARLGEDPTQMKGKKESVDAVSLSYLSYPAQWEIHIFSNNVNIFTVDSAVVTNLRVQYSDDDFIAYRDGMPVKISLAVTFREIGFMTVDKFSDEAIF